MEVYLGCESCDPNVKLREYFGIMDILCSSMHLEQYEYLKEHWVRSCFAANAAPS